MSKAVHIYTDGSYNQRLGIYGCGAVLVDQNDGEIARLIDTGTPDPGENGWNINGEIAGALMGIEKAMSLGYTDIKVFHDYEGIGMWADGLWKTKKPYTCAYADKIREYREAVSISFKHVKGHAGNKWNEVADELAKAGAKIEDAPISDPDDDHIIADGVSPACAKSMKRFWQLKKPSFKDFAALKTGGMDAFSKKKRNELEEIVGEEMSKAIKGRVHREEDYDSALRWYLRGLSADDASHKANVDGEISTNALKSSRSYR